MEETKEEISKVQEVRSTEQEKRNTVPEVRSVRDSNKSDAELIEEAIRRAW